MGEFLKQKICRLEHLFLSQLLFLTSSPFTLDQDNFKWLEERLPQKFCDTSRSSKCSSSAEKGEVRKTGYSTLSRKKEPLLKAGSSVHGVDSFQQVTTADGQAHERKIYWSLEYAEITSASGGPWAANVWRLRMFSEKNIYAFSIATVFSKHLVLVTVRKRIWGNMNTCSNPLWLSAALK